MWEPCQHAGVPLKEDVGTVTTRGMPGQEGPGPLPDPNRLGGPGWLVETGGRLTGAQRRRMVVQSLRTQRELLAQRFRRRPPVTVELSDVLVMPDSRLVRDAEEAARVQPSAVLGHAYRTSVFARALALLDGVDVDHELLVVCGLLHDVGLVAAVAGEDFTVRSAACATEVAGRAGRQESADHLADAIIVHTTVGVDPDEDGALGAYTQFGAMVDLVGLRERHLPHDLVARTVSVHPRSGLVGPLLRAVRDEAHAVPGGRFAFLRRVGFGPAVRLASVPSRP